MEKVSVSTFVNITILLPWTTAHGSPVLEYLLMLYIYVHMYVIYLLGKYLIMQLLGQHASMPRKERRRKISKKSEEEEEREQETEDKTSYLNLGN